jgi:zinc transport system permease protein
VSCIAGIYLPLRFDLPVPSGGAIILTGAAIFIVTMIIRSVVPRFREASI